MSNKASEADYNEFYDPRLVAVYNTVCALGNEKEFYTKLARDLSAKSILDLGCGTGLLTIELAKLGYKMIGVEPSKLMLDVAIRNSKGLDIDWIHGDARTLRDFNVDLAIMTGHVAQFHLEDKKWENALESIYRSLKTEGYLAFESRNPDVQPWNNPNQKSNTDWYAPNFHRKFHDPTEGEIEYTSKLLDVDDRLVTSEGRYLFSKTGKELTTVNTLVFRTKEEIERSLTDAGFIIDEVYGDWDWSIADSSSPEFIYVAKKG